MLLPELSFATAKLHGEELFLGPNVELTRVLLQGNPVYLDLILSGATQPKVRLCFPEVGTTWVYANGKVSPINLIGEHTKPGGLPLYAPVEYRYGMELKPWMFYCWLDKDLAPMRYHEDNIINYSILNCSSGHAGALIRIIRHANRTIIGNEWMEIYYFDTGNDYDFAAKWREHSNTKLIACFVPEGALTAELRWVPQQPL